MKTRAQPQVSIRKLGDLAEAIYCGPPLARVRDSDQANTDGTPVISLGDLDRESIDTVDGLSRETLSSSLKKERFTVQDGDILVSCRGTVFRVSRVTEGAAGALPSANIMVIRPGKDILSLILWSWLRTPQVQAELKKRVRSATGQLALNLSDIAGLDVPLPPLAVQRQLAVLIEATEKQYHAALTAADLRRQLGYTVFIHALNQS